MTPNLFRTRRTVKPPFMEQRPIPRKLLLEILEDAHWAPTHGLTCPWRYEIFEGDSRVTLGQALVTIYDQITAPSEIREDKRAKLAKLPAMAPVCITVAVSAPPGGKISEMDEIAAACCSVQNLLLSAHQKGIGSFWASPTAACSSLFAEWLNLDPKTHKGLGIIYLGYPKAENATAIPPRVPLLERVRFHE